MSATPGASFDGFVALIARLRAPGGCPWDREQTHRSLKPMTIEEAYEVLQAIDDGDDAELAGELGDLLLQVVFHARIAEDEGRFTIGEVIARVHDKMVRRHPHVFGGDVAGTSSDVLRNWEAHKRAERAQAGKAVENESMMDGVPRGLPAVMECHQLTTRAARVGFDWPDAASALDKLEEEIRELREAAASGADPRRVEEEIGDLLFSAVNVTRLLGADPESALKAASRKFRRRFRHVEDRLRETGRTPGDSTLGEMDGFWNEAKARETRG